MATKKKKIDIAKETRGRAREAIGPVPRTKRIPDKRKKEKEMWERSEISAWMSKL